ncbi:MAG TPA: putative zinc-binding protein [Telluria sp.]|nr:putative zinc-binding protein [Telluria sp.]
MASDDKALPLVYSCSGCSSAAQLANHVALRLDRMLAAEMSCIAGVGGDVAPLVRLARSGRRILAIDGCAMACARQCLARHGVTPDHHLQLGELGVRKRRHEDFDASQAGPAVAAALDLLGENLPAPQPAPE